MADRIFTLQEELILLWLEERTGRLRQRNLRYALAAAALAELLLNGRLREEMGHIEVRHGDPLDDPALDLALRRMSASARTPKLSWWVRNLYTTTRQPVDLIAERLIEYGAVTRRERTALLVIHWADYPVLEPAFGQRLHRRIRTALASDTPIAPRLAALIALLHHSGGMEAILDRAEQRTLERRIAAIIANDGIAFQIGKAIDAVLQEDREAAERASRKVIVIERPTRRWQPRRPRRGDPTFPGRPPAPHQPWSEPDP